jgi:hypothetical protein
MDVNSVDQDQPSAGTSVPSDQDLHCSHLDSLGYELKRQLIWIYTGRTRNKTRMQNKA